MRMTSRSAILWLVLSTVHAVSGQVLEPADCIAPTATAMVDFNNVRALVENGGLMWQNRAISSASYEVPAGGGVSSLYAGSFWAGGLTSSGQLRLAANTFGGQGGDYSAGPLAAPSGETSNATCLAYDNIYPSLRSDVVMHLAYHQALLDGTLEQLFPEGYAAPAYFYSWPAHGDVALGQDQYLAPFIDFDGDGAYNPDSGDAPGYNVNGSCDPGEAGSLLSGDANWFWIFNDAGRVHNESNGAPIGMEIRAQSWAFNDGGPDFDNATFYTYELLNQGPFTLNSFQTGVWVDADVGTAVDDYVGCDVSRGLAFAYNGLAFDGPSSSSPGYGENPPAVGLDFFYGLYQDADGLDNPQTTLVSDAQDSLGISYAGMGFGYGDGIVDNERMGMTRFVYYNNSGNSINGEPSTPLHFYNYMSGLWKNGQSMSYGGDGVSAGSGANLGVTARYMFPGDSDPLNFGTGGVEEGPWSEVTSGNLPGDRRFVTACGPVTFEPGERNELVFGMVWARGENGPESSLALLKETDDRIQALFDNCFEGVGCSDPLATNYDPSALFGSEGSCVYPTLVCNEALPETYLANVFEVSFEEDTLELGFGALSNPVGLIVALGDSLALLSAEGMPPGIDVQPDQTWDSGTFACIPLSGSAVETGSFVSSWTFVVYSGGAAESLTLTLTFLVDFDATNQDIVQLASPPVTRIEGRGSGRKKLRISQASELALVQSESGRLGEVTYQPGFGPFDVFLLNDASYGHAFELAVLSVDEVDNVPFELRDLTSGEVFTASWTPEANVISFLELGLALAYDAPSVEPGANVAEVLGASLDEDAGPAWWLGIEDQEGYSELNWIRSGSYEGPDVDPYGLVFSDLADPDEVYENVLSGTWAPYSVVSASEEDIEDYVTGVTYEYVPVVAPTRGDLDRLQQWNTPWATSSVKVVFSPDTLVWTRCAVLEMQPNQALAQNVTGASGSLEKMNLRRHPSVDKQGRTVSEGGNPTEANAVSSTGMGWFPGYAIDTQTGERLNMAFGEDSWLVSQNGQDMMFNPGSQLTSQPLPAQVYAGGQHWIYVFKNGRHYSGTENRMPAYDQGTFLMENLTNPNASNERRVFRDCIWVGSALSAEDHSWDEPWSEFAIHLDVGLPFEAYSPSVVDADVVLGSQNNWLPLYRFALDNLEGCTDEQAYNFDPEAVVEDGSCVDGSDLCAANALGLLDGESLGLIPADSLALVDGAGSFVLTVGGTVSPSGDQELSVDNAVVQSVSFAGEELSILGLEQGSSLSSNACVLVEAPNLVGCTEVLLDLEVEAAFFGTTIPAGNVTLTLVVCGAQSDVEGCTYEGAQNYNAVASVDDGSCLYVGCTDPEALNFNPLFAIEDGSCLYGDLGPECVGDIDLNGSVGTGDLLLLLTKFSSPCDG